MAVDDEDKTLAVDLQMLMVATLMSLFSETPAVIVCNIVFNVASLCKLDLVDLFFYYEV